MKYLLMFMAIAILAACDEPEMKYTEKRLCKAESQSRRAQFVLACVKNGNPMSDEEPEDLVSECRDTATEIFCPRVGGYQLKEGLAVRGSFQQSKAKEVK